MSASPRALRAAAAVLAAAAALAATGGGRPETVRVLLVDASGSVLGDEAGLARARAAAGPGAIERSFGDGGGTDLEAGLRA
ncbi:MAG TPA: hypothetical protein VFS92_06070, partial [Planctomycetota bacterium]|nr:hypothetical protein [Planctomycetota bacterium]